MPSHKRQNGPLFTVDTLQMLHEGLSKLLPTIIKFVKRSPSSASAAEMLALLSDTETKQWTDLQKQLHLDGHTADDSVNGEENDGDLLHGLLGIFRSFDDSRHELLSMLKKLDGREQQLLSQIEDLNDQINTGTSELLNAQHRLRVQDAKLQASANAMEFYEKQVQEKSKQVSLLQRGATAIIWEKEKERLMQDASEREKDLAKQLSDTKDFYEKRCARNESKIAELEEALHKGNLSNELSSKDGVEGKAMDGLKKQVYYYARDLLTAGQELYKLQKDISGILAGLKRDFRIVHQKFIDDHELSQKHIDKLATWLDRLHQGFSEGSLAAVRSELPEYYYAVDKEVKPIKIRLASVRLLDTQAGNSTVETFAALAERVDELEKEVWEIETERAIEQNRAEREQVTEKNSNGDSTADQNPLLVNERGIVNTTLLIRHFPTLSVDFVKEQYANFKHYDTDNNGVLDLSEMMGAVTKTIGHKFSAKDVADAMKEVDDDNSQTLDFFEYLKVATNIMKKTGKASIYNDDELLKNKKQLSKVCSIQ